MRTRNFKITNCNYNYTLYVHTCTLTIIFLSTQTMLYRPLLHIMDCALWSQSIIYQVAISVGSCSKIVTTIIIIIDSNYIIHQ